MLLPSNLQWFYGDWMGDGYASIFSIQKPKIGYWYFLVPGMFSVCTYCMKDSMCHETPLDKARQTGSALPTTKNKKKKEEEKRKGE